MANEMLEGSMRVSRVVFTLVNNGNRHNRQTSSFFALPVLRVLSMRSFVGVTPCKHKMG